MRFASSDKVADVIHVVVRGDQVVDLFHAGVGDRGHDPIQVSRTRKPRVDKGRLARWRHVQRGLAAFDVDDPDVERLRAPRLSSDKRRTANDEQQSSKEAFHRKLPFVFATDSGITWLDEKAVSRRAAGENALVQARRLRVGQGRQP